MLGLVSALAADGTVAAMWMALARNGSRLHGSGIPALALATALHCPRTARPGRLPSPAVTVAPPRREHPGPGPTALAGPLDPPGPPLAGFAGLLSLLTGTQQSHAGVRG